MPALRCWQRTAQIPRRIALGPPCSHGVPKYLPAVVYRPVRCLKRATGLNASGHRQNIGRIQFGNCFRSDPRKYIAVEKAFYSPVGDFGPRLFLLGQPLARDNLEAAGLRCYRGALARLLHRAGVHAISQQAPGIIAAVARFR